VVRSGGYEEEGGTLGRNNERGVHRGGGLKKRNLLWGGGGWGRGC